MIIRHKNKYICDFCGFEIHSDLRPDSFAMVYVRIERMDQVWSQSVDACEDCAPKHFFGGSKKAPLSLFSKAMDILDKAIPFNI